MFPLTASARFSPADRSQVSPTDSTTYHLTAKGAGGTQEATARLTVTQPPPPPPPPAPAVRMRTCLARTSRMFTSTTTSPTSAPTSRPPYRPTCVPGAASQCQHHDRRALRRARLHRVQPGPWRQARQRGEKCLDGGRIQRQPHQDDQLRQGKAVLHRKQRSLLAAEPPRPLVFRSKSVGGDADCRRPQFLLCGLARPCAKSGTQGKSLEFERR